MKHGNISIFIPHNGCPHRCSFCSQSSITGQIHQPGADEVRRLLSEALCRDGEGAKRREIAFFGGSFTALDRVYMLSLLDAAKPFVSSFAGIRISTRPDYIHREVLSVLKEYGVTAVELGAQSMDNSVLELNERGHTALDVENASALIKEYGFSLGLQMMTGLYGSDFDKDRYTAQRIASLEPDTVRIYPTVIMKNTRLADYYLRGSYVPYTLDQSVELCSELILFFERKNINIIRLGLHCTDSLLRDSLGDNYHPAFKELCESRIFYNKFAEATAALGSKNIRVTVNPKSLSKFYGQKKSNLRRFTDLGFGVRVCFDDSLDKYELHIEEENET